MNEVNRREFIKLAGIASASTLMVPDWVSAQANTAHVVVVGGGFAGATCANYLRQFDHSIRITLIEPKQSYITCPFSNKVIGGLASLSSITHGYDSLRAKRSIEVVHDRVVAADPAGKKISLQGGQSISYDHLVVAPGISFLTSQIEGYSEATSQLMPHAWQAGEQTTLLRQQLEAMPDGGVVVITTPPAPFRAPPAPYERASLIAHYLKQNKPKSKLIIIGSAQGMNELDLFKAGWEKLYPGLVEYVAIANDVTVTQVDGNHKTVRLSTGDTFKGALVNLIPPQRAGQLAQTLGLTNAGGWCPVKQPSFESVQQSAIHVIGDACQAGEMAKIGHSASIQGKICAAAIVSQIHATPMPEPVYSSSIYSLLSPKYAISDAAVYRLSGGQITTVSSGHSSIKASKKTRRKEASFAEGWYKAITSEMFVT